MEKKIFLIGMILLAFAFPLISAASGHVSEHPKGFDLYYLLVENVFGSFFITIIGLAVLFFLIGVGTRMSTASILFLEGTFLTVMLMGNYGAIAGVVIFIGAFYYFISGLLSYLGRAQ